jgi:hypothetical protein
LSLLRWIAPAIPTGSRWYPVFQRYLGYVGGRVKGFGGDPGKITPSPTGGGVSGGVSGGAGGAAGGQEGERTESFVGKVSALEFDRFGDFRGFRLDTEDGERHFRATEPEIEHLGREAWAERTLIRVIVKHHESSRPSAIELLRLPHHEAWHRHHG